MFQGILFVVLAAFVAFGATLFMAVNTMNARSGPAEIVPAQTIPAASETTPAETPKAAKPARANRSDRGPTSGKKTASPSATPVVAPKSATPPSGAASLLDS